MGKVEILAELPYLKPEERAQVFDRLCELEEADLLQGQGPTEAEKKLLDQALSEFERDGQIGIPWRDAFKQIRGADIK